MSDERKEQEKLMRSVDEWLDSHHPLRHLVELEEAVTLAATFDIEKFIAALPWTPTATEHEKALIAGNLRNLYNTLRPASPQGAQEGETPETDALEKECAGWDKLRWVTHAVVKKLFALARSLERDRGELMETLQIIVALDDGDKPDLWHFEQEFQQARALLSRLRR